MMLTVDEAQRQLLALAEPLSSETINIEDAVERTLAAPVLARRDQPPADLSAMDGFAVRGRGPWQLVGEARCGAPYGEALQDRTAVYISTGAGVPPMSDGIVLIEDAHVEDKTLAAASCGDPKWIRRRGFDFCKRDAIAQAGTLVGPAQIALLRMAGLSTVSVAGRPRVTIIECGDELVADPAAASGLQIPASNGAMVAAMCRRTGANVRTIGPLPDEQSIIEQAFETETEQHLVVTIGGASVGRHDLIRPALERIGADLSFWKIAMRPGKPFMVARRGRQTFIGLPGNPVSSFVTAYLFVLPYLRALEGRCACLPASIPLPLAAPLPAGGAREEFLRGQLVDGQVEPMTERDSSALRALAGADLLIRRPVNAVPSKGGDTVPCYLLDIPAAG